MREESIMPYQKAMGNSVLSSGWEQGIFHEEVETIGESRAAHKSSGHSRSLMGLEKAGEELEQREHQASGEKGI